MSSEEPKCSRILIKVLKASKSTYWYADLVGRIVEVERQVFNRSITYKSLDEEASYFFDEDIEILDGSE